MKFLQQIYQFTLNRYAIVNGLCNTNELQTNLFENLPESEMKELRKNIKKLYSRPESARYLRARRLCENEMGNMLLDFAISTYLSPEFSDYLLLLQQCKISPEFVAPFCERSYDYPQILQNIKPVSMILPCESKGQPYFRHAFSMDERLFEFLLGIDLPDNRLSELGAFLFQPDMDIPDLYAGKCVLDEIEKSMRYHIDGGYKEPQILQLMSPAGCGKRMLIKLACHDLGKSMLFIDCKRILKLPSCEHAKISWLLRREALLMDCGICFYNLYQELCSNSDSIDRFVQDYIKPLESQSNPICICSDTTIELIPKIDRYMDKIILPPCSLNERIALWTGFSDLYDLSDNIDCVVTASKFKLNAREIAQAAFRLRVEHQRGTEITEAVIAQCCTQILPPPSHGIIKKLEASYSLDDLKIPKVEKEKLYNICAHIKQRHQVYDTWHMEKKFPYGRNISAVFVGAPGTGKTMAANVLSKMVDLPLYRVDLSQILDTTKEDIAQNLDEIFSIGEKTNTILFFNEGDSLFQNYDSAKHDAPNREVSYILQKIMQYDGIVILSVVNRKNIDESFMCHMRYYVEFSMPHEDLRREMWKSAFTEDIPREKDIDFRFIARKFEFSGGSIKNVVLNAAFCAAQCGQPVSMQHLVDAIKNECLKLGMSVTPEDFELYHYLF